MRRLKLFFFLTITLLCSGTAYSQGFNFADIPWGSSLSAVKSIFISRGFTPGEIDRDGDLRFRGEIAGFKSSGVAIFSADKGVQKILVLLATPDDEARSAYNDLKNTLIQKYGTPSNTFEFFEKPYYKGDGYENSAIKLGKATYSTYWIPGSEIGSMSIRIAKSLAVEITYEGPEWTAEATRRKASGRSAL